MSDRKPVIRVREVMKTNFGRIDGTATIHETLVKMKSLKTAVLVVNKKHEDDEYGIITVGDIARHVLAKDRAPDRVNVYEIMEKPVISVYPEMDIRYCSRLFATHNLVRAPVLDNGEIIGTISPNALVMGWITRLW